MTDRTIPAPQTPFKIRKTGTRLRSITALILREMQAQYGRSPGGYIWALVEPLGMILVLSFGFSLMLRSPSLGNSFILFYATGLMPFSLYGKMAKVVAMAMSYSRALLTYPVVIWVDAVAARILLTALTSVLVSFVMFAVILTVVENRTILEYGPIIHAYVLAILLGSGVGLCNAVFFVFFPVWKLIWSVVTRPLFLASGVIFIYEDLPGVAQDVLWWNPLMHLTGMTRAGFYPTYQPQYISSVFLWTVSLILLATGVMLMRRHHVQYFKR